MIEERARVVEVRENDILIEADRQSACGKCAQKNDCGQSAIAQWAASKMVNISVPKPTGISIATGDTVVVGINEQSFIKASLLIYLLPLVAMFAVSYLAAAFTRHEWQVIVAASCALLGSFYLVKLASGVMAQQSRYQLQVINVVS